MNKMVRVTLIGNGNTTDFETKSVINEKDNTIKYVENDELNTIVKFDYKDYTLTRKNKNMKLRYNFVLNEVTDGELEVTGMNTKMILRVETRRIKHNKNNIGIEFLVENEKFKYSIEVK